VLAQVKLSFKGTSGAKLVVTRSLQLTVKKAVKSVKTLEGQLLMIKDGERTTISSRVAELDQIMPQYLGVSEAILDSVIFCHQDESLWPMSEPGTLKRKFDEIFAAMRYTKAIDIIKNLRKAQNGELEKHRLLENQFKTDKDRGERTERRSIALQEDIEKLREKSERANRCMQEMLDKAKEKHAQKSSFSAIVSELAAKRNLLKERQDNINDLRTDLQELTESDEWLESTLAQYEERMATYKGEEESHKREYRNLQEELSRHRRLLASKLAEQGQHQAEKENYERQVTKRVAIVKEAAHRHGIRGYDGDIDTEQIQEFINSVGKLSREKSREFESIQKSTEDELRQAQVVVTELENRRSARTQDKLSARQAITANERKISTIQSGIDDVNMDEGVKAMLESTRRDLKDRLDAANNEFEVAAWDRHIYAENGRLRELEEESDRLNDELVQSTRLARDRAQLEYNKKELKDRQHSLDTLVAAYGDKIASVVGENWQASNVEREFQVALDQKSRAVADAQLQRDNTNRELAQFEFKLSTLRDARRKKTEEMRACEKAVLNSIIIEGKPLASVDDYLSELDKLISDRDTLKSDLDNFTHLFAFWSNCIAVVEKQNKCHLCDRKFTASQEKSSAIAKLRQRLAEDSRATISIELQGVEEELKEAQASRSQYETYKRLSDSEMPTLTTDLKIAEDQRDSLLASLEEQDAIVNQEELARKEVETLSKTVSNIARYVNEISGFQLEVNRLSTQQKSTGSSLSLEEIQEQLARCTEQTRALKVKISKLTSDKDRSKVLINALELELRDAGDKLSKANFLMEKKQGLLLQIRELKDSNSALRDSIQRADNDLDFLAPQIAKARTQYDGVQQQGQAKAREIHEESSRLSETVNKLKVADDAINSYLDSGGPGKLSSCQNAIKTIETEVARIETELSQVTLKANKLKEQVDNSERTKRSISDNIKFRKNLRALEVLQAEIEELESRNATEDYNRLQAEAQKYDMEYQKFLAERGSALGSIIAKDSELARLLSEWEIDFKDAARKYREAHIKVETTKAAIDDLGRYGTALDHAIMKYHSMKMEEINRIAGELWQSTYQGTDVDTILIRSDAENAPSRRNYNYRVCMVKQDAEMDMRGRCSAGQRVLASIIIRLALAECFGVNCGVRLSLSLYIQIQQAQLLTIFRSLLH
jgi:DNA repair protein RAD50